MPRSPHRGWRRIVACILGYALAAQGFIFALDVGRAAVAAAGAGPVAGFELCVHDGDGAAVPGAPSHVPDGDSHCALCLAGALYVNCAPPAPPQYTVILLPKPEWPPRAARLTAPLVNHSAWPRGPPAAV